MKDVYVSVNDGPETKIVGGSGSATFVGLEGTSVVTISWHTKRDKDIPNLTAINARLKRRSGW